MNRLMRSLPRLLVLLCTFSSSALADHVPPVGLDYQGTWAILIAAGVIGALLVLSLLWAYLDGQFSNPERIKFDVARPDDEWPYGRGTSIEQRPEPNKT